MVVVLPLSLRLYAALTSSPSMDGNDACRIALFQERRYPHRHAMNAPRIRNVRNKRTCGLVGCTTSHPLLLHMYSWTIGGAQGWVNLLSWLPLNATNHVAQHCISIRYLSLHHFQRWLEHESGHKRSFVDGDATGNLPPKITWTSAGRATTLNSHRVKSDVAEKATKVTDPFQDMKNVFRLRSVGWLGSMVHRWSEFWNIDNTMRSASLCRRFQPHLANPIEKAAAIPNSKTLNRPSERLGPCRINGVQIETPILRRPKML